MPSPHLRTRSRKRVTKALPKRKGKIQYTHKVNALPRCRICGCLISGVPHLSVSSTSKLNRTSRRVCRPLGAQICHVCLKSSLKQAARNL